MCISVVCVSGGVGVFVSVCVSVLWGGCVCALVCVSVLCVCQAGWGCVCLSVCVLVCCGVGVFVRLYVYQCCVCVRGVGRGGRCCRGQLCVVDNVCCQCVCLCRGG